MKLNIWKLGIMELGIEKTAETAVTTAEAAEDTTVFAAEKIRAENLKREQLFLKLLLMD